jgi:hypothetical protein
MLPGRRDSLFPLVEPHHAGAAVMKVLVQNWQYSRVPAGVQAADKTRVSVLARPILLTGQWSRNAQ